MGSLQRNGGTAGVLSAVFLAIFFLLLVTSGLQPQDISDPARAIPAVSEKTTRFQTQGLAGTVAVGFGAVFFVVLALRLREQAPTRGTSTGVLALIALVSAGTRA